MMPDFQALEMDDLPPQEEEIPDPQVSVIKATDTYGKFVAEPLKQGYGITLGNPLRRILYGSLIGTAVTWVKIDGILHEYTTIPHVKEEVSEFLLNVMGIRLKSSVDRPGKMRLDITGEKEVTAGDIMASSDFQVVNPELHLATLDSDEAKLSVEFNVERGFGYVVASQGDGLPIGVLPVDAIYSPTKKVNYQIEKMRIGHKTDLERLILEVWTDGSVTPLDAVREAANILAAQFYIFVNTGLDDSDSDAGPPVNVMISPKQFNTPVEQLDLSSRTLNCLKRAEIDLVGQILSMKKTDLLQIRNFGAKSVNQLYDRLRELDLLPSELDPDIQEQNADASDDGEALRDLSVGDTVDNIANSTEGQD